jgi:hypothetical protein
VWQILAAVKAARTRLASLGLDRGSGLPEEGIAGEETKEKDLFFSSQYSIMTRKKQQRSSKQLTQS